MKKQDNNRRCRQKPIVLLAISFLLLSHTGCGQNVKTMVNTGTNPDGRDVRSEYYGNGKLKSEFTYIDGRREGPFTTWYSNGQKASTGTLLKSVPYDDVPGAFENTYDGLLLEWYKDGKQKLKANY